MKLSKLNITRLLAIALTVFGCLQLAGQIIKSRVLRGIGFSFGISPHPIVFGTVEGVEGFNTQHVLRYTSVDGYEIAVPLDQDRYSDFQGSYLLKNSYSIFLAYPHMLKSEQVDQAAKYLLCKKDIFTQFGITDAKDQLSIQSERVFFGKPMKSVLKQDCNP